MDVVKNLLINIDSDVMDQESLDKLYALNNEHVLKIVNEFVSRCKPSKVTVITDAQEDIDYVRQRAIEIGDPTAKVTAEKYSSDPEIWSKLVVHSVTYHEEE